MAVWTDIDQQDPARLRRIADQCLARAAEIEGWRAKLVDWDRFCGEYADMRIAGLWPALGFYRRHMGLSTEAVVTRGESSTEGSAA
jgi:hypothetical protein